MVTFLSVGTTSYLLFCLFQNSSSVLHVHRVLRRGEIPLGNKAYNKTLVLGQQISSISFALQIAFIALDYFKNKQKP